MRNMIKVIVTLVVWLVVTNLFCIFFIESTPPGGVSCFYYLFLALLPLATFRAAKWGSHPVVAIIYGLIGGFILAFPVFMDSRTGLSLNAGYETVFNLCAKIMVFAFIIAGLCWAADQKGWAYYASMPSETFPENELEEKR